MNFGSVLCLGFIAILSIALTAANQPLVSLLAVNAVVQLLLFLVVACIPLFKTGRMSYVDIAWPFGVAAIGGQILLFADGDLVRKSVIAGVYLMIGLRMGFGALTMAKTTGVIFKTEFPRYSYRRMTLSHLSEGKIRFHMLTEVMAQGFANMSVLTPARFSNRAQSKWQHLGLGSSRNHRLDYCLSA